MAKANSIIIPSVLSFEKKLVCSDGYLYGTTWDERQNKSKATPLALIEKSVRGTISHRLGSISDEAMKKATENPNPQKVDACALGEHQDTLKLSFTLKVLGGIETPSACSDETFKESYTKTVKNYIAEEKFTELAKRYAINIANGRYLWRNRVGAEKIEVIVKYDEKKWIFDAGGLSIRDFDTTDVQIGELAQLIAQTLCGEIPYLLLKIEAYALVGTALEVYPSEEMIMEKNKNDKNKKSKVLYSVDNVAALHSQKIGNALRTIDTWYPEFDNTDVGPIAIEVYGAVTNLGRAFRTPKDKVDFYSLFDRYAVGEALAEKEQEHYVMAVLVRGGVFGKSAKES